MNSSISTRTGARKPHIALVHLWRVINSKGGTEKVLCDMGNALVERGYDVSVICYDSQKGQLGFELSDRVNFHNTYPGPHFLKSKTWINCRYWHPDKKLRQLRRAKAFTAVKAQAMEPILAQLPDVDVFISFIPEATYVLRESLKVTAPLITMYHLTPEKFVGELPFDHDYRQAISRSDVIQILDPSYEAFTQTLHPGVPVVTIGNVAPQFEAKTDYSPKKIVNVARIAQQKRPELLLQAFAKLKDRFPDWTCEWWGELTVESGLSRVMEREIERLQLSDRFFLKGPTHDVVSVLKGASIFAFPSAYEGQSLAMLEALSMGLPLVGCTDCASVTTTLQSEVNGLLVEPTVDAYADALARLMQDEALRSQLGQRAHESMKAFSPDTIWNTWDTLIRSLIRN